ncbi:MAG: class A beta-lactamase-related serine hydrolase [Chromatiales bacterium]|nr:class A beta-lactamase-related serine hydrolase [Chromatiales bacterium]
MLKSDIGSGTVTAVGGTGGGFGRDYGGGRSWKRDPVNTLSHGASAMKVARLYYLLLTDRLVAPDLKAEIMQTSPDPGIGHKFVAGLAEGNPDAEVNCKSGTWTTFHADSGIVVGPDYSYIIVAITDDPEGAQRLPKIAQAVDAAVRKKHAR